MKCADRHSRALTEWSNFKMDLKKRDKVWNIRYDDGNDEQCAIADNLRKALNVSDVIAKLLCNRGYVSPEQADKFLKNEESILHDPLLLKDVYPAVERIEQAISQHEKIVIYGDYDVDGITATIILYKCSPQYLTQA